MTQPASKRLVTEAAANSTFAPLPDGGGKPVGKGEVVINVRDYGAKGDGTTDDTAAIQSALTAARAIKARVLLRFGGTYLIRGSLNIGGCHVVGYGATLKHDAVTAFNMTTAGDAPLGTRIEGLTFDASSAPDSGSDTNGCGVYANVPSWVDLTIRDCHFKDFKRTAIYLRTPGVNDSLDVAESRTMVDNCRFTTARLAVYANQIKDLTVRDCRFDTIAQHAILATSCLRPRITGNRLKTITGNGITVSYCAYAHISDNTVDGATGIGIAVGGGGSAVPTRHGTIVGNTIVGATHGISLDTTLTGQAAATVDAWFTVTGNVCKGNTINGIYVNNSSHVTLAGNMCEGNQDSGIRVGAAYCTLVGNECRNNAKHGIALNGSPTYPNYGHHRLAGNLCSGNVTTQFYVESASVVDVLFAQTTSTVPTV